MHIVFYSTNDVFAAEEILNQNGVFPQIVPTPVQDKAYCGVCLKLDNSENESFLKYISHMEYNVIC